MTLALVHARLLGQDPLPQIREEVEIADPHLHEGLGLVPALHLVLLLPNAGRDLLCLHLHLVTVRGIGVNDALKTGEVEARLFVDVVYHLVLVADLAHGLLPVNTPGKKVAAFQVAEEA